MDSLKKLICSRHGHKGHLTKLLIVTDEIHVLTKLSTMKDIDADSILVCSDVFLLAENLKQLCFKANLFTELVEKIIINIGSIQCSCSFFYTHGSEIPHARHFGARLPKLEISAFSGEPLDWQPFW